LKKWCMLARPRGGETPPRPKTHVRLAAAGGQGGGRAEGEEDQGGGRQGEAGRHGCASEEEGL